MNQPILERLVNSVVILDVENVKKETTAALQAQITANDILNALNSGMQQIGQKYEAGEYFLTELVFAGEVLKTGVELIKPHLVETQHKVKGKIVAGTVKGDLHDLGKNLFLMLAKAAGFEVEDLGIDVCSEDFVERTKRSSAHIVAMSALMSTTQVYMKDVIEALKKAAIRDSVRIIIGGGGITERFATEIGADAAVNDAVKGVRICQRWVESIESAV